MRRSDTSAGDSNARRNCAWLLFAAALIHNLEEAIAYPITRGEASVLLAGVGMAPLPSPTQFWLALAAVTVAVAVALFWSQRGPVSAGKLAVLRIVAAVLLANILIPHLPAAVALGGYAPGLASALLINLPASLIVLWWLRRRSADETHPHSANGNANNLQQCAGQPRGGDNLQ